MPSLSLYLIEFLMIFLKIFSMPLVWNSSFTAVSFHHFPRISNVLFILSYLLILVNILMFHFVCWSSSLNTIFLSFTVSISEAFHWVFFLKFGLLIFFIFSIIVWFPSIFLSLSSTLIFYIKILISLSCFFEFFLN